MRITERKGDGQSKINVREEEDGNGETRRRIYKISCGCRSQRGTSMYQKEEFLPTSGSEGSLLFLGQTSTKYQNLCV